MRFHNITCDDMLNGAGLRVVLWVSGCSHRCPKCQNPMTWDPDDGVIFDEKSKEELFGKLSKDYIAGITLSGGDPLYEGNREEITALCKEIKEKFPGKNIWLYTGYVWERVEKLEVMRYVDVVIDGKFIVQLQDNQLHWRGSANQRVIDVKKSFEKKETVLYKEN